MMCVAEVMALIACGLAFTLGSSHMDVMVLAVCSWRSNSCSPTKVEPFKVEK